MSHTPTTVLNSAPFFPVSGIGRPSNITDQPPQNLDEIKRLDAGWSWEALGSVRVPTASSPVAD